MAGIVLIWLGVADMRATGRTGSPLLVPSVFLVLLCPILFVHFLSKVRVFRDMRSGRSAIARWTLSAEEFGRFRAEEERVPAGSIMVNFYQPPRTVPPGGVEVIFSADGVLIGGGYFPLSARGARRLQSVRYIASQPPAIEFGMAMNTLVRTSSATIDTQHTVQTLRVPVASDARGHAGEVVQRYQAVIDRR